MFCVAVTLLLLICSCACDTCDGDVCYWEKSETPIDPRLPQPDWIVHPSKSFAVASTELTVLQYRNCVQDSA